MKIQRRVDCSPMGRKMDNPYEAPRALEPVRVRKAPRVSVWSVPATVVCGLILPGVPSVLMRRSVSASICGGLIFLAIPVSFGFFGPFWGMVLFPDGPYSGAGLYPFLASCVIVPVVSVIQGLWDRRVLLRSAGVATEWQQGL